MEIDKFISEVIVKLASGVYESQKKAIDFDVVVNPQVTHSKDGKAERAALSSHLKVINVNFDISIAKSEKSGSDEGVAVALATIGFGKKNKREKIDTETNRIQFNIPICFGNGDRIKEKEIKRREL